LFTLFTPLDSSPSQATCSLSEMRLHYVESAAQGKGREMKTRRGGNWREQQRRQQTEFRRTKIVPRPSDDWSATLWHFLNGLLISGYKDMHELFGPNCCVAASKTVLRVLGELGVQRRRVLPVRFEVWNTEQRTRAKNKQSPPEGERIFMSMGITTPESELAENNRFFKKETIGDVTIFSPNDVPPGHVVAAIDSPSKKEFILIDSTIAQLNEVDQHIFMPQAVVAAQVSHDFIKGESPLSIEVNGCMLRYWSDPENEIFTAYPVWNEPKITDAAVRYFMDKIHKAKEGNK
jgi:hypothetical protein